jgi:hypothetical protein
MTAWDNCFSVGTASNVTSRAGHAFFMTMSARCPQFFVFHHGLDCFNSQSIQLHNTPFPRQASAVTTIGAPLLWIYETAESISEKTHNPLWGSNFLPLSILKKFCCFQNGGIFRGPNTRYRILKSIHLYPRPKGRPGHQNKINGNLFNEILNSVRTVALMSPFTTDALPPFPGAQSHLSTRVIIERPANCVFPATPSHNQTFIQSASEYSFPIKMRSEDAFGSASLRRY